MDVTVIGFDGMSRIEKVKASYFDRILDTIVKDQLGLDEAIEKTNADMRARATADGVNLNALATVLARLEADTRETVEYARAVTKTVDEKVDAVKELNERLHGASAPV